MLQSSRSTIFVPNLHCELADSVFRVNWSAIFSKVSSSTTFVKFLRVPLAKDYISFFGSFSIAAAAQNGSSRSSHRGRDQLGAVAMHSNTWYYFPSTTAAARKVDRWKNLVCRSLLYRTAPLKLSNWVKWRMKVYWLVKKYINPSRKYPDQCIEVKEFAAGARGIGKKLH
jgi:hypothetical protein